MSEPPLLIDCYFRRRLLATGKGLFLQFPISNRNRRASGKNGESSPFSLTLYVFLKLSSALSATSFDSSSSFRPLYSQIEVLSYCRALKWLKEIGEGRVGAVK